MAGRGRPGRPARSGADLERRVCWRRAGRWPAGLGEVAAALVDPETGLCARSARFTQADVVEHLCALSGGRLIDRGDRRSGRPFLASELAVRLTPDAEAGRRRPAEWSTAAHRALEDRTRGPGRRRWPPAAGPVAIDRRSVEALGGSAGAGRRPGGRGARAGRRRAGCAGGARRRPGTARRPCARGGPGRGRRGAGRWSAVATTAKAVAELAGAGLDARTIARLRIDLDDEPWPRAPWSCSTRSPRRPRVRPSGAGCGGACPGGSAVGAGRPPPVPTGGGGRGRRPRSPAGRRGRIPGPA